MYKKYEISGRILVKTGLHIGGSSQYSPIGSVDASVVRDPLTNEPIIPGSSLKGKMRTLLARAKSPNNIVKEPEEDALEIKQLFGKSSNAKDNETIVGRLHFADMKVANGNVLKEKMFLDSLTEVKFENTITRSTGGAKPRQIERVVPGVEFKLSILYDAWFSVLDKDEDKEDNKGVAKCVHEIIPKTDEEENMLINKRIEKDFELIHDAMNLLELDYLGGNGSRGYGKIEFKDVEVKCVFGSEKEENKFEENLTNILLVHKETKKEEDANEA